MNINDIRHKKQELSFYDLEQGQIYISSRMQKYVILTGNESLVCMETGDIWGHTEISRDDVYTPVKATLVIE